MKKKDVWKSNLKEDDGYVMEKRVQSAVVYSLLFSREELKYALSASFLVNLSLLNRENKKKFHVEEREEKELTAQAEKEDKKKDLQGKKVKKKIGVYVQVKER